MVSFRSLLIALVAAAMAVAGFLTWTALRGLGVLGDHANRVYVAKDVTADILPPPMYLIEARLVASQALEGYIDADTARREFGRLKAEYDARAAYWAEHPPYGLERELLGTQHRLAEAMLRSLETGFLPRLVASDRAGARAALDAAQQTYGEHRTAVDQTVKASTAFARAATQGFEAAQQQTRRDSLLALGLGALALVGLLRLIRHRVAGILGAEPEALAAQASRLADGQLTQPVPNSRADSAAGALERMRSRLNTMLEEAQRSAAEAEATSRETVARAQREAIMARDNARIRTALDRSTACLMMTDTNHAVVYANDAMRALFRRHAADLRAALRGIDVENPVGLALSRLEEAARRDGESLERRDGRASAELRWGGATLQMAVSEVRSADGTALGVVIEWRDRTDEAAAERQLEGVVEAAVDGDLTRRVDAGGQGGFFGTIAARLNALMDAFETLVGRMQRAAGEVDARAREVAQGSADVGRRTEQQSSSLEETAASMEQMTATVKQNAEQAARASELAVGALNEAQRGRTSVTATIEAVQRISESSRRIGEITSLIDELAFQTNLLALNAAVEAARAGEQGRGFAVVAAEVRALAIRSAAAAKEIRDLVAQSRERVEAGETLVQQAGSALDSTMDAVQRMTHVASEIALANREQASGVTQIDQAVTEIDRNTQETAALMEEAGAAATSLLSQAALLSRSVSRYRAREASDDPPDTADDGGIDQAA
jgi:methyl-accepting chemotaxis protein